MSSIAQANTNNSLKLGRSGVAVALAVSFDFLFRPFDGITTRWRQLRLGLLTLQKDVSLYNVSRRATSKEYVTF
jgi:hypothetical protein